MLAPLLMKRVWKNVNLTTAIDNVHGPYKLTMSMDHLGNGTGLSRLHGVLMKYTPPPPKRLGAVITQDNWPIAYVSRNSLAHNQ